MIDGGNGTRVWKKIGGFWVIVLIIILGVDEGDLE